MAGNELEILYKGSAKKKKKNEIALYFLTLTKILKPNMNIERLQNGVEENQRRKKENSKIKLKKKNCI